MAKPDMTTYVRIMCTLFARYAQSEGKAGVQEQGRGYQYEDIALIILFTVCQCRRIYQFKTQACWLEAHPTIQQELGLERVPHRSTLSRRYKQLYTTIGAFILFIAHYASELDECFGTVHFVEDKSLFKAAGPVWHQSDRKQGQIPAKLRHLDQDATWSKSGYQGWV